MPNFYDVAHDHLAFAVVATGTLRQQSKKRKVGTGPLNVLLTVHLLANEPDCGILTSDLTKVKTVSLSLLRCYIRQLETEGYLMRYRTSLRASRRIRLTQKGHNLIMHCLMAMRLAAKKMQKI